MISDYEKKRLMTKENNYVSTPKVSPEIFGHETYRINHRPQNAPLENSYERKLNDSIV